MIIKSLDQLNPISLKIIKRINKEDNIFLFGEIGVGKTTFARTLINNIQIQNKEDETEVLSPTFNIVYEYEVGKFKIMHYDLYRLKTEKDIEQIGVFDQIINNIKIIEWPEIIENKPSDRLEVYMLYEKERNTRKINFRGFGKWEEFNAV